MTNSNYGFILIDTEEKRKACEPMRPGDEAFFTAHQTWQDVSRCGDDHLYDDVTYRRPIPPGEGWEIVPKEEAWKLDGSREMEGYEYMKDNEPGIWNRSVTPYMAECIIAFRRRITKPVPPPSDWQPIRKDRELNLPNKSQYPIWITDGKMVEDSSNPYVHHGSRYDGFPSSSNILMGLITHWQPMPPKPAPPIPPPVEKTVAERCWDAWEESHPSIGAAREVIQFTINFLKGEKGKE